MDEKTKELIAIGASVAGHCQPCLTFHVNRAKDLGIGNDEIKAAVEVGKMVEKAATSAMSNFADDVLGNLIAISDATQLSGGKEKQALRIYDPPLCCPTGVCGPSVNNDLVQFAGALKKAAAQGIVVERWNLAQQPQAFAENRQVKDDLSKIGHDKLPFIYVNDQLKLSGRYPTAKELFAWLGIAERELPEDICRSMYAEDSLAVLVPDDEKRNPDSCCADKGC